MKQLFIFLTIFTLLVGGMPALYSQPVSKYVNLFVCTGGDNGQLDPSATVPFGMVKPGPDTDPINHSGYDFYAKKIIGFSHNRVGGVGCDGAGGNLRIFPFIGTIDDKSGLYIKESEKAEPGYYSVKFNSRIVAELTATNQTAFHRYTFPKSASAGLSVDINSSFGGTFSSSENMLNDHEFLVRVSAGNVCTTGRYTVYFHVWCNKKLDKAEEKDGKIVFKFQTIENEEVLLNVTCSSISGEDARKEWEAETGKFSFDQVKKSALNQWEKLLSTIIVEGKEEYKILFYTHLYHILLNPVKSGNRDGQFRATDGEIYHSKSYSHYDCWSMWDNFRNKFSLYSIIVPRIASDMANSLVDLYKYGIAFGSGFNEPVPTVRTEHSVVALLDWYNRGITNFDIKPVYRKLCSEISNIPNNTPDTKLESCYDYWALAQFAKILGKQDDYDVFLQKSQSYKKVWKEKFLVMNERSDVMHGDGLYEGTLWQYRWYVPYDVDGLIGLMGGKEKYTSELEYFFNKNLYSHGNEPDIEAPYMFNFSNKPWLTQFWVNKILTKETEQWYGTHVKWAKPYVGRIYKNSPDGFIPEMDDDEGTMSGWYVLASLGIYPVLVGDPVFQLSTPIFDKITIHIAENKNFVIITKGLSDSGFYIQSVQLNGKAYHYSYLSQQDIVAGGTLELNVSDQPNEKWPE
jgi:putative alpha-1,2-mannosidase